ncbi:MAG: Lrp/AsnC family transcriptional regulator [Candidatus Micrarchaeota archaeon]|nr:Lrp/AsnC family transcriptional regulator [Candidatus Micrarchaeota archaeon]
MANNNTGFRGNGRAKFKRMEGKSYNFYLVHPPQDADANLLARQLMSIKNVEEVFVTDGDYGFVVKARNGVGEPDDACEYISRKLGCGLVKATSHYQYRKWPGHTVLVP